MLTFITIVAVVTVLGIAATLFFRFQDPTFVARFIIPFFLDIIKRLGIGKSKYVNPRRHPEER